MKEFKQVLLSHICKNYSLFHADATITYTIINDERIFEKYCLLLLLAVIQNGLVVFCEMETIVVI